MKSLRLGLTWLLVAVLALSIGPAGAQQKKPGKDRKADDRDASIWMTRKLDHAQKLAQVEHISGHRVAKVVIAMADGLPVELILPATRRVCLEKLRKVLGAWDVRLASETEMEDFFPGCEVGAVPPLDHWPGVP